jgi:G3E family GTPase
VTGFLGAGKTTLLRRLARAFAHKRIAFIVNDLADMDVDGRVLDSEVNANAEIVRLSSGCICCTIRGEYEAAINDVIERHQPDVIVVESSGVTNPQAVLHGLKHPRLRLDSVITVVDAERFLEYMRLSAAIETQVYMADFVLVNKRELVTPAQLDKVIAQVQRFNAKCAVLPCTQCDVPLDALFGAQAAHAHDELAHLAHDHLHEDRIDSVVIPVPAPLLMDKLTSFLKSDAMKDVYRAKGFVQMQGEAGFSLFNFVPRRYGLERGVNTSLQNGEGFIVFIGRDVSRRESLLKSESERCAG